MIVSLSVVGVGGGGGGVFLIHPSVSYHSFT